MRSLVARVVPPVLNRFSQIGNRQGQVPAVRGGSPDDLVFSFGRIRQADRCVEVVDDGFVILACEFDATIGSEP